MKICLCQLLMMKTYHFKGVLMQKINKLEAESLRLSGFKIVRTKHSYFLMKSEGEIMTGYVEFL